MFNEFFNIVFSSLKLDKNLYRNNKNFGEAAIYFAGLIMILDGVAGACNLSYSGAVSYTHLTLPTIYSV